MQEISLDEAETVGGAFSIIDWGLSQILGIGARYIFRAVMSGEVDYSGLAESQGSYYNTVGA